jgi:hypothetical protein
MEFAERFKGKTTLLTREGILSVLTQKSTPIDKSLPPFRSQYKNMNPRGESMSPTIKPSRELSALRPLKEEFTPKQYRKSATIIINQERKQSSASVGMSPLKHSKSMGHLPGLDVSKHSSFSEVPLMRRGTALDESPLLRSQQMNMNYSMLSRESTNSSPFKHANREQVSYLNQKIMELYQKPSPSNYDGTGRSNQPMSASRDLSGYSSDHMSAPQTRKLSKDSPNSVSTKVSGMSFVDRQERMVSKYKIGIPNEMESIFRKPLLEGFNY